jgi:hypothetical protein
MRLGAFVQGVFYAIFMRNHAVALRLTQAETVRGTPKNGGFSHWVFYHEGRKLMIQANVSVLEELQSLKQELQDSL